MEATHTCSTSRASTRSLTEEENHSDSHSEEGERGGGYGTLVRYCSQNAPERDDAILECSGVLDRVLTKKITREAPK